MISLWALVSEGEVEAYCGTLVLPVYLSHLSLGTFRFSDQPVNRDGREPLEITYLGDGRLEEYLLHPEQHALDLIRFVCPGIDTARIRLPKNDAYWHWAGSDKPLEPMRVYFDTAVQILPDTSARPNSEGRPDSGRPPGSDGSYVSVSRGHVFIDRATIESYIRAWLVRLGVEGAHEEVFDFGTPSGGVDFEVGPIGGQFLLDGDVVAEDLIGFAGLKEALAHVADLAKLDFRPAGSDHGGINDEGAYLHLAAEAE